MTTQQAQAPELNYCPRNRGVETNLRCGKCGEFICPRCLVQTPVGARCPDCARLKKNPAFDPSRQEVGVAVAAGLAVAGAVGAITGAAVVGTYRALGYNGYLIVALLGLIGAGWLVGETVYRVARYKRSRGLMYAAGMCAFAAYIAAIAASNAFGLRGAFIGLWPLLGLSVCVYVAMGRVRP